MYLDKNLKKNNSGVYWTLDILKIVLAIIITIRHCGQSFYEYQSLFVQLITNTLSPICVPTFFVISGFLFFQKGRSGADLKQYIIRILRLYLVWSIIYLPLIVRSYTKNGMSIGSNIVKFIQSTLFDGTYYHLWYLPSLAVAIVFVYVVNKKIETKPLLMISFILYVLGTLVDTYGFISSMLNWNIYKQVFLTTRNGIFFGVLFVVLGKVIFDYQDKFFSISKRLLVMGGICSVGMLMLEGWKLSIGYNAQIVNMNFTSMIIAPMLVIDAIIISKEKMKVNGRIIRNISTVLFCCHPWVIVVIRVLGKKLSMNANIETIVVVVLSLAGSYLCVLLSERIKALRVLM